MNEEERQRIINTLSHYIYEDVFYEEYKSSDMVKWNDLIEVLYLENT